MQTHWDRLFSGLIEIHQFALAFSLTIFCSITSSKWSNTHTFIQGSFSKVSHPKKDGFKRLGSRLTSLIKLWNRLLIGSEKPNWEGHRAWLSRVLVPQLALVCEHFWCGFLCLHTPRFLFGRALEFRAGRVSLRSELLSASICGIVVQPEGKSFPLDSFLNRSLCTGELLFCIYLVLFAGYLISGIRAWTWWTEHFSQ